MTDTFDFDANQADIDYLESLGNDTVTGNNGPNTLLGSGGFGSILTGAANIVSAARGKPKPKKATTNLTPILLIGGAVLAVIVLLAVVLKR